ncbi:MAG TPA: hypothetical protein VJI33_03805 [Candidatus Paceibacterota bacterium]
MKNTKPQQNNQLGVSLSDEPVSRLFRWDLSRVRQHLAERKRWSVKRCLAVDQEYRRFIALHVIHPKAGISPSKLVDEMWHTHVLFTRDYAKFCETIAGKFIHHNPFLKADQNRPEVKKVPHRTMMLYRRHFGKPDPKIWPWAKCADCTTASCGDCTSSDCGPRCT